LKISLLSKEAVIRGYSKHFPFIPFIWINITGKLPLYSSFSLPGPFVFLRDTLEKSSRLARAAKATGSRVWRLPEKEDRLYNNKLVAKIRFQ
jgi:hypothetical protein